MPKEKIVTDQASEEDRNGSSNITEESGFTRRDFLQQTMAVAGGLAMGSILPGVARAHWFAEAQKPKCIAAGQILQSIMEIKSSGTGTTKTLKAVLKVLDEDKTYWGQPDQGQTLPSCQTGRMRYIAGYDVNNPSRVWPTASGVPNPAPTLRAGVGDTVQITLVNNANPNNFPNGQMDVAEHGKACEQDTTYGSGVGQNYPGDPTFENPPNCFHGSSSTNLHFHGTHISPSGIADNVLINVRPSPRTPEPNSKPLVTEETVKGLFSEIFAKCANQSPWPLAWKDWPSATDPMGSWPASWQKFQQSLLEYYDNTATWLDKSPPPQPLWPLPPNNPKPVLPLHDQLWWNDQQEMTSPPQPQLPQYYVGAFPNCFTIPKWNGQPDSMGQSPGTHWYHAHKHGSTALNLANGMAGALIIEGDYDATLRAYYQSKGQPLTEQVLMLQQFSVVLGLLRPTGTKDLVSVNGQYTPILEMKPNQTQMWRIVNACHQAPVPLNAAPTGLKWVQTAQDGVQLDPRNYNPDPTAATNLSFPVPAKAILTNGEWLSSGSLAPGNRIDLLVQAPNTTGDYKVTFGSKNTVLLTVRVTGTAVSPTPFPSRDEFPKMPGFLADIRPPVGMVKREIRFNTTKTQLPSPAPTPTPQGSTGGRNPNPAPTPLWPNAPPTHTINGKQFSGEIDQYMKLGATEEWSLFNDTPLNGPAHPFHIHINPFQVIALFDPTYMDASLKTTGAPLKEPWVWWDNFAIPPGGWAKMWTRFVDFTGTYVFHCHILGHEDRGMMQMVNVSPGGTAMKHQ